MILPMVKYLEGFGVQFHYNTKVTNIAFDCASGKEAGHPHRRAA